MKKVIKSILLAIALLIGFCLAIATIIWAFMHHTVFMIGAFVIAITTAIAIDIYESLD